MRSILRLGNRSLIVASVNVFTCPHGGFFPPHAEQVVRPTRVSWRYGTPIRRLALVTRASSPQTIARCFAGICSKTSAQNTKSNARSGNGSFSAVPWTHRTRGCTNLGRVRSRATTLLKRSASNSEKCPSLAPISNEARPDCGNRPNRSSVLSFSDGLALYSVRSKMTPSRHERSKLRRFGACPSRSNARCS
jgi:hypothetical protein